MNNILKILPELQKDFPQISFVAGESFLWSPHKRQITYTNHQEANAHEVWALLHEVGHATLKHTTYDSDFQLLKLESEAWHYATSLGKKYGAIINPEHIQDCLDTYRDWLHIRAQCPSCSVVSLQRADRFYQCFNCKTAWGVPKSPLCRVTRHVVNNISNNMAY